MIENVKHFYFIFDHKYIHTKDSYSPYTSYIFIVTIIVGIAGTCGKAEVTFLRVQNVKEEESSLQGGNMKTSHPQYPPS